MDEQIRVGDKVLCARGLKEYPGTVIMVTDEGRYHVSTTGLAGREKIAYNLKRRHLRKLPKAEDAA